MCAKLSKKSSVKNILVVSLSNIGDVVLTCPIVDILRRDFPKAQIVVVVGPKAMSLFEGNPNLKAIEFDKHASLQAKRDWFFKLRAFHFDAVVDLRNSLLPLLLMPPYSTSIINTTFKFKGHMKDKHLLKLKSVYDYPQGPSLKQAIVTLEADRDLFQRALYSFVEHKPFIVIVPGAADSAKRWPGEYFSEVGEFLAKHYRIVFCGDHNDVELIKSIQAKMSQPSLSLAGQINLRQLGFVLSQSALAITHDSGPMHIASYFNVPVVALFGPTDPHHYGPWSERCRIVRRNGTCPRCKDPHLDVAHTCMAAIKVEDVLNAVEVV